MLSAAILALPAVCAAQDAEPVPSTVTANQWGRSVADPQVVLRLVELEARRESVRPALRLLRVVNAGDAVTTAISLHMGAVERNAMLPQAPALNVGMQVAQNLIEEWAFLRLAERKPLMARILAGGCVVFESWVVGHNIGTIAAQHAFNQRGR
jgi:hypothetical protein